MREMLPAPESESESESESGLARREVPVRGRSAPEMSRTAGGVARWAARSDAGWPPPAQSPDSPDDAAAETAGTQDMTQWLDGGREITFMKDTCGRGQLKKECSGTSVRTTTSMSLWTPRRQSVNYVGT